MAMKHSANGQPEGLGKANRPMVFLWPDREPMLTLVDIGETKCEGWVAVSVHCDESARFLRVRPARMKKHRLCDAARHPHPFNAETLEGILEIRPINFNAYAIPGEEPRVQSAFIVLVGNGLDAVGGKPGHRNVGLGPERIDPVPSRDL